MEFWKECQPRAFRWMLNARSTTLGDLHGLPTQRGTRSSFWQPPGRTCSPGDGPAYNGRMPSSQNSALMHGTTVLCVRKEAKVVLIADGQVTMGDHVMKHTARKTRRLYQDKVIAGFAGSTADAISLFERFEGKLQEFS